jgi:hypothetical protein
MTQKEFKEYYLDTARILAIQSTLIELVGRHGISEDQFRPLFQRKVDHYMMRILQTIEDTDPNHAAALQILSEDELLAESELPLFFP